MQGCSDCFIPQFSADAKEHVLKMLSKKALFESHCLLWMIILVAVILQRSCRGLRVNCTSLGLQGVNTGGVYGVSCELSRTLYDNETIIWMLGNFSWIGNCTREYCIPFDRRYRLLVHEGKYLLYPIKHKRETASYLMSVCDDSLQMISHSNIIPTSSTLLSFPGCSCINKFMAINPEEKPTDDNLRNMTNINTVVTNENPPHYDKWLHVSTVTSTLSTSHADYSDFNSPRALQIDILAIVIPVSLLALMSSIGACCVGCRVNKPVPILPQSISFHRTNSSDMNSEINLTSVTPRSQITPSHLVSSAHSLVDNSKVGEEEAHIYETPDACLVGEKPPSLWKDNGSLQFPSDEEYRRTDSGVQNYEKIQLEPEVYNKLKRIKLAPMAEAGESARDLYNEFEGRDSSKCFYHTLDCNLADNTRQITLNSL